MIGFVLKYRYFALVLGAIALISGAWVHGYFKGKASVRANIAEKQVESINNSVKGSNDVRKKEQSLDSDRLDAGLCKLGIVRGNKGCA